ncbi:hypothetical protein V1264_006585 [Littorina saxatilis]|uniref:Uncharacterized protein n=1 Tax=Littorina saxatilis TaxID=31220 RepID=A0AAN9AZR7_9CAEN
MKLVEGDGSQGNPPQPSYFLPCSIVILFSIPPDFYERSSEGANHFEINNERFSCYVDKVNTSKFMLRLQARLPVQLLTNITEHNRDLESEDHQNKIFVSWVDVFQGLERDVVVFLPGDMRKILVPGLSHNTSIPSPAVSSDQPAVAGPSTSPVTPPKKTPTFESKKDMSLSYWRTRDIRRYTDWDKYNLVLAATRCTSQLILLVP